MSNKLGFGVATILEGGDALDAVHTNIDTTQDVERDRRSYGEESLQRLEKLKRKYDPENVFHLNPKGS